MHSKFSLFSLKVWNGFQIFTFFVWYLDFIPTFGEKSYLDIEIALVYQL